MKLMKLMKLPLLLFLLITLSGCNTFNKQPVSNSQSKTSQAPSAQASQGLSAGQTTQAQVPAVNVLTQSSVAFTYKGLDADKLSPSALKPDGKKDGHFHITIPINQQISLKSIWIRYNEFGKWFKWGWIYNKNLSLPSDGYVMAVFDSQGTQILPQGDIGYIATPVNGAVDLDLYISELNGENNRDTLAFAKDDTFTLEVDYVLANSTVGKLNSAVTLQ